MHQKGETANILDTCVANEFWEIFFPIFYAYYLNASKHSSSLFGFRLVHNLFSYLAY